MNDSEDDESPEFSLPQSDTPASLRPDLSQFGIDEVDRGICLDTADNRRILRANKMAWITMYDHNGAPLNTLEARSNDMTSHASIVALNDARAILKNPNDKNSDYLTGEDLIYEPESREHVPHWVLASTRKWMERETKIAEGWESKRRSSYNSPPGRCEVIKSDGVRCRMWHGGRNTDNGMCRLHLGSLQNTAAGAIEKARSRAQAMAPSMIDVLEELAHSATSEPTRLGAANSLLDRAGVRVGVEIEHSGEIEVRPAADEIRKRLDRLAKGAVTAQEMLASVPERDDDGNVVDAEVVAEEEESGDDDF